MTSDILNHQQRVDLRRLAYDIAVGLLGQGEEERNNWGPFVLDTLGGRPYIDRTIESRPPEGPAWCALLVNYGYRTSAEQLFGNHRVLPFDPWRRDGVPEAGALTLARRMLKGGRRTIKDVAQPGDVVLFRRRGGHHLTFWSAGPGETDAKGRNVPEGRFAIVEGNAGPFPARVRCAWRNLSDPDLVRVISVVD